MSDEPVDGGSSDPAEADPQLLATRKLLASVEELRALLAPLTPDEREQVLALARSLKGRPGSA
jgi:hypothetical protein